jgi:AAA+ superfamily predicted ATPase
MNEVTGVASGIVSPNPPKSPIKVPVIYSSPNFRASSVKSEDEQIDAFIKQQEKAQKGAKRDKNLSLGLQIGTFLAFAALAGTTLYMYFGGKGGAKTTFEKIADKMPSLNDDCINPKSRHFITQVVNILKTPTDIIKYTGAKNPRMVLLHGPTGTGKTFTAKMLAKEMGAEYGEIQFSDLSSEYVGKTAVNISAKFKELSKMARKNPNKQYVVAFNEIDSLINNVEKLGANNMHLGQNRTAFLNGLDSIKNIPNLTIVGTTNINPKSANLDAATLSRLGNIFEIQLPSAKEIMASLKFHLSKSEAAKDLILNDAELARLAKSIEEKAGAQRDVENIVDTALTDFTIAIKDKTNAKDIKLSSDYLQKVIDSKETWAAGIA